VDSVVQQARACFAETEFKGALTSKERQQAHALKFKAGVTYVIDLHSPAFDTLLRLENAAGQLLAENDDIEPSKDLNSRFVFTAPQDGTYRLVATSFQQQGVGPYTLTVRKFLGKKK
jgi:hypothetical protein